MKMLITGANGFVGSKLSEKLLMSGHDVNGLVRRSSDLSFLKSIPINLCYGDITRPNTLSESLEKVDIVFHVAGLASDWGSLNLFRKINAEGTQHVLEASRQAGVKRFVHVSSVAVMGFGRINVTEDMAPFPTSFPYVISKMEGERIALEYGREHNLPVTVIRPGDVYGPHDRTWMLPMLTEMERGKMGHISGGKAELAPVYIDNLVQALELAAQRDEAVDEAFFITDGIHITWQEIVRKLSQLLDQPEPKLSVPFPIGYATALTMETLYRLFKMKKAPLLTTYRITHAGKNFHFSIEKARQRLGYDPDQNIDAHLQKTVAWFRQYSQL